MSSSDLVSMFLAIELQSYGLYIFATLYRDSELATSAGLTYFLLGGLSSCFILLGSCLLYLNSGITNLDGIYVLSSLSEVNGKEAIVETNKYLNLALLIMSVGYLFKVSAAPFHFWSPERGHGKSSTVGSKLPNSGNTLELQVPSYIRKDISGRTNHSGMVTSLKASERNVGNRGSKSAIFESIAVKEQRVYGSWCGPGETFLVRNSLNGLFPNYRVIIPTKVNHLTNKILCGRSYTSTSSPCLTTNLIINPWFITGFSDAEACFTLSIIKNDQRKVGWRVFHSFQITLHRKDIALLEQIQSYFLVGSIISYFLVGSITFDIDPFLLCAIIPIKNYSNAEADKGKILSENTNKSGFYTWKNLVNKKQYIGSSSNLRRRFNSYFNPNHLLTYDYM